jgi:transposase-like protein
MTEPKAATEATGKNLEMHGHPMHCPYCHAPQNVETTTKDIMLARRNCPACHNDFLIDNGKPEQIHDNT